MSMSWQESYRFSIKRPDKFRRSFDIIEDRKSPSERVQTSIKKVTKYSGQAAALESLNANFQKGILSELEVEVTIRDVIKPQLEQMVNRASRAQTESTVMAANMRIFNAFWSDRYENNRRVIDRTRVRNQFLYALRKLEPLSLSGCEEKELQRHWDQVLTGTAHRRYGRAINTLLRFLGRPTKLILERNDDIAIEYITADELKKLTFHIIDPDLSDAVTTLFSTGVRTGELFALTRRNLKNTKALYVDQQIDRQGVRRATKNRRKHDTIVLDSGLEAILRWLDLDFERKMELRHSISHRLAEISEKILGRRITPHHLRHSYAILLLEKGVPLDRVAQLLGDTVEVTQKHYTGFVVTDHAINSLHKLINQ